MPIARWNSEIRDNGDPLLWMESIPYWETRGYVSIVMRNYWMYERQPPVVPSAQPPRRWHRGAGPKFPGLTGAESAALCKAGTVMAIDETSRTFKPINIAVLTVSDTRTA